MIRALIFDFDGTILDTETPEYNAWTTLCREENCAPPALSDWVRNIGRGANDTDFVRFDPHAHLETATGRTFDREEIRARRRVHYRALIAAQSLRDGIQNYLRDAKAAGLLCAVASSSGMDWVGPHLEERGLLPFFDAVATGDEVARTKPAPDVYRLALSRLSVSAQEALALEDSPNGVAAAKAAGIFTVAFPNSITQGLGFDHADMRFDSLAGVPLADILARADAARQTG